MRLLRLTLDAFGPFSGVQLDLSGGAPGGLHLIYGPNEAGKSTSLRAVSALLFGMPHQSRDAHLHPSADLRVSAVLESDGAELAFSRLKRRKDGLVDARGNPLPDDALLPFLRGLDERSFEQRFGLNQEVLEQGAQALLGGSEEGLFSAGTAGAGAGRVLAQLEAEMAEIYRPRGQKFSLNAALSRLVDADKALRFAERPPEKYQEQKAAHDRALAEVARVEAEQHRTRRELGRLGRLASVLTEVSLWLDADKEFAALGSAPLLGEDAEPRRQKILAELREAELESKTHAEELQRFEDSRASLPPRLGLVDAPEDRLSMLQNQIGSELKGRADLPKRRAKFSALAEELERLKQQLGRADTPVDELLIDAPQERRIRSLVAEHGRLTAAISQLERSLARASSERQDLLPVSVAGLEGDGRASFSSADQAAANQEAEPTQGLGGSPSAPAHVPPEGLARRKAALARGRDALVLGRRCDESRARLAEIEPTLARMMSDLLPSGELGPTEPGVLEDLLEQGRELERTLALAEEDQTAARRSIEVADRKAHALREALELPTEEQLRSARAERDALVSRLEAGEPGETLGRELRRRMMAADALADRLRREAVRVSEHTALLLAAEDARSEGARADQARQNALRQRERWQARYDSYFRRAGLAAPSPDRARAVARRHSEALDLVQEQHRLRSLLRVQEEQLEGERQRACSFLLNLAAPGSTPSLPEVVSLLEHELEELSERAAAGQERERQLRTLLRREAEDHGALEQARAQLQRWRDHWAKAMAHLGRPAETSTEEAETYLSGLSVLSAKAMELKEMKRRVDGIERDTRAFEELLFGLARGHATELLDGDISRVDLVEAAETLLVRAREAVETERERTRLGRDIEERKVRLTAARQRLLAAEAELSALMADAQVTERHALAAALERSQRKRQLRDRLSELAEVLRGRSGGRPLPELVEEVSGLDHDELRASIFSLESRQEEVDQELRLAQRDATELGRGLLSYSSEDAAEARQRVAERRSAVLSGLRDYLVRRAAAMLLREQIELYAAENQGPILERAEEHFARLTLGRYTGLRVGLGEKVLRCQRDGKDVEVDGLSRGTRAQLYLALRIASLERHFEHHGPVPLLLDDLFVDFDDDRSVAAFELLGELAQKTQILYYTHLARDVEAADSAVPSGRLFLHKLGVA